jgi:hypothetical protein
MQIICKKKYFFLRGMVWGTQYTKLSALHHPIFAVRKASNIFVEKSKRKIKKI